MSIVIIAIGIAMVGFVLTDFLRGLGNVASGPMPAGEIAGETISREEYAERYQQQVQQYSNLQDAQRGFVMDQVWNQLVAEKVYNKEMEKIGYQVGDQELLDMFVGKRIHPDLRQIPFFQNEQGQYDPQKVREIISNRSQYPQFEDQLISMEEYLVQNRGMEHYNNMVKAGFISSKAAARQKHREQNRKANIEFLAINYSQIPDSLVTVTDADLNAYIRDHQEEYKQEEETYVKYVRFPIEPSEADSTKVFDRVNKYRSSFEQATNDSLYTSNKSPIPYTENFRIITAFPEALRDSLADATLGTVMGPYQEGNMYRMYKLVNTEEGEETYHKVRHILIKPEGTTDADSAAARQTSISLARQANDGNFFDLANENSRDFKTKTQGGELGWYSKGAFGEDFDETVAGMSIGQIRGGIKSNQGYHVVQLLDETTQKFSVAQVQEEIFAGSATVKEAYSKANQFLYAATQDKSLDSAAVASGENAIRSNPLTPQTRQVSGLTGGRDIVLWALDAEMGDLSQVIEVGPSYVVAEVVEKREEGTRPLNDLRFTVESIVRNQKKAQIIIDKLNAMTLGDDLNAVKDAYGAGAFVNTAQNVTFTSSNIPGIGGDPYIIGKVTGMEQGQVSKPLEGQNGVYIVKVTSIQDASELDDETLLTKKKTEANTSQTQWTQRIQPVLTEIADVKDERYKIGY